MGNGSKIKIELKGQDEANSKTGGVTCQEREFAHTIGGKSPEDPTLGNRGRTESALRNESTSKMSLSGPFRCA